MESLPLAAFMFDNLTSVGFPYSSISIVLIQYEKRLAGLTLSLKWVSEIPLAAEAVAAIFVYLSTLKGI